MPREDGQFKPGQSGNPGGQFKNELSKIKHLNTQEFSKWAQKLWRESPEKIAEIIAEPGVPMFVHMLAKVMSRVCEKGDAMALAQMLPYFVGKPKESLRHEFPDPCVIHLKDGEKLVLGTKTDDEEGSHY